MENREFGRKLEARTRDFATRIVRLSILLPDTVEGRIIRNQLAKSGTSIGANYREANRARSKADFKSKIKISESETGETIYWLEIIKDMNWVESRELEPVITETNELLFLLL
jgi:four helix bundle protein